MMMRHRASIRSYEAWIMKKCDIFKRTLRRAAAVSL